LRAINTVIVEIFVNFPHTSILHLRMDQLSPEVRQKVVKMSDGRLRQKLVQAGYCEVDVVTLDRANLLEYYAKVVLTETAYVPAKDEQDEYEDEEAEFAEGNADVHHTAGGDKSVEERRLAMQERKILLEERRLEEQKLLREQQRMQLDEQKMQRKLEEKRLEEQRLQREQQVGLEEQWKQRELDERKWREEMELKRSEKAYRDSTAVKIKTWGDALRNTISKTPSEGIDVVSWFVSVDKLFEQFSVPADLQANFDTCVFIGPGET